jgi:hypothetical protein
MTGTEFRCIEPQLLLHIFQEPPAEARFDVDFVHIDSFVGLSRYLGLQTKHFEGQWTRRCVGAPPIMTSANCQRLSGWYLSDLT